MDIRSAKTRSFHDLLLGSSVYVHLPVLWAIMSISEFSLSTMRQVRCGLVTDVMCVVVVPSHRKFSQWCRSTVIGLSKIQPTKRIVSINVLILFSLHEPKSRIVSFRAH